MFAAHSTTNLGLNIGKKIIYLSKIMEKAFSEMNLITLDATVSIGPTFCSVTDGARFLSNYARYLYFLF